MKNIFKYVWLLAFVLFSCSDDDMADISHIEDINMVSFMENMTVQVQPDGTHTQTVSLYSSQTTSSDRTFNLTVLQNDLTAGTYSAIPATITIPANENVGSFDITVDNEDLMIGEPKVLQLQITNDDGTLFGNDTLTLNFEEACLANVVVGTFAFDGYASENTWEIYDAENNVIHSGGGYADGQTSAEFTICLEDGTYTFVLNDAYGDGMYDGATTGSFTLTTNGATILQFSGNFGPQAYQQFTLPLN